ncbi:MAG: hypothetical protein RIS64_489 [Bacteroidota bacterium]|jgi:hypothetical protein
MMKDTFLQLIDNQRLAKNVIHHSSLKIHHLSFIILQKTSSGKIEHEQV